jgi:hypothetical protein
MALTDRGSDFRFVHRAVYIGGEVFLDGFEQPVQRLEVGTGCGVSRVSVWMPKRPDTAISLGYQSIPIMRPRVVMDTLSRPR